MMIHKIGRKHDIRNIEIFRKFSYIFFNQRCLHQPKRCIRIFDFYAKNHPKKQTDNILYKFAVFPISTFNTVSDHCIILFPCFPELFKLCRICLSVGICLKNIICIMSDCISITIQYRIPMSAICFCQWCKQRFIFRQFLHDLVSVVFASIVDYHKS